MNYDLKKGDKVRVTRWGGLYSPEKGNEGTVVSFINGYPKVRFIDREPLLEDLNGYVTVDPVVLIKI